MTVQGTSLEQDADRGRGTPAQNAVQVSHQVEGRGKSRGRPRTAINPPEGWVAPPIAPAQFTPPKLRKRGIGRPRVPSLAPQKSPTAGAIGSPLVARPPLTQRPRCDSVLAHPENCNGGHQQGAVACNLNNTFSNIMRVYEWMSDAVNLADIEVSAEEQPLELLPSIEDPVQDKGVNAGSVIPCLPRGANGLGGRALPKHVWVPLNVLGFNLDQWGGLQNFLGDVQQGGGRLCLLVWD